MTIKIYSTPTCHYCKLAKDYFKSKNLEFTEIDVAKDIVQRKLMQNLSEQFGVPVIEIGKIVLVGFNKEKLDEALAKKQD